MSKHIPLPLERRGEKVYTRDTGLNRPTFICSCGTVEQADEIVTALEMHSPLQEALAKCMNALTDETGNVKRREADACVAAREALTYPPPKKATAP